MGEEFTPSNHDFNRYESGRLFQPISPGRQSGDLSGHARRSRPSLKREKTGCSGHALDDEFHQVDDGKNRNPHNINKVMYRKFKSHFSAVPAGTHPPRNTPAAGKNPEIAQGDWVSIETPEGRVRARANLNADIDLRVVVGQHGWWQGCAELDAATYNPFEPEGLNYNLLIGGETLDPISGTASHRASLCEIRPVA